MAKFHEKWTVLPHGPVEEAGDGNLTVEGHIVMPLGNFPRRMTVVQLSRKRSAIFSAIALDEPGMRRVEELGEPAFLVVPNRFHRLDARAWKQRYPKLRVLCPPGARDQVAEAVPVDATEDVLGDKAVDFIAVAGMRGQEAALVVRRKGETTLIVNDIIAHVRHPPGLGAKVMARLFGFGVNGPQVPRIVRRLMVDDKESLSGQFRAWARLPHLKRIIVSHGEPITDRPRQALEHLAARL